MNRNITKTSQQESINEQVMVLVSTQKYLNSTAAKNIKKQITNEEKLNKSLTKNIQQRQQSTDRASMKKSSLSTTSKSTIRNKNLSKSILTSTNISDESSDRQQAEAVNTNINTSEGSSSIFHLKKTLKINCANVGSAAISRNAPV